MSAPGASDEVEDVDKALGDLKRPRSSFCYCIRTAHWMDNRAVALLKRNFTGKVEHGINGSDMSFQLTIGQGG